MKTTTLVLGLLVLSVAIAVPAAADPIFTCIPESPCCEAEDAKGIVACVKEAQPEPCRIGDKYYC